MWAWTAFISIVILFLAFHEQVLHFVLRQWRWGSPLDVSECEIQWQARFKSRPLQARSFPAFPRAPLSAFGFLVVSQQTWNALSPAERWIIFSWFQHAAQRRSTLSRFLFGVPTEVVDRNVSFDSVSTTAFLRIIQNASSEDSGIFAGLTLQGQSPWNPFESPKNREKSLVRILAEQPQSKESRSRDETSEN